MNRVQIDNWRDYLRDGDQFLKTALNAHRRQKKTFSTDTLYNLTCMAIEKLIMAFLMKHGDLAENHTMGDLLRALEKHCGNIGELRNKLLYLDGFQEICDLDTYTIRIPGSDDIKKILAIGEDIQGFLAPHFEATQPAAVFHRP